MAPPWAIKFRQGAPVSATRTAASGKIIQRAECVWTLAQFCAHAGKSRRQIYRDLRQGRIHALGKFLGEWLIEPRELARLTPPPTSLQSLFPEYDLSALDLVRDEDLFLSRVLRFGGPERLRWAFDFYGKERIRRFVRQRGPASLDPRSLRLWSLYLGVRVASPAAARLGGIRWGGAT